MSQPISIGGRMVGPQQPVWIVAELSANHRQDFSQAVKLIEAAKEAGADAIKLQTYTADTLTIDCNREYFRIGEGTLWSGRTLYDLYNEAYTPWEWHEKLIKVAQLNGLQLFSTPFDPSAVDFLETLNVPCHKIASFEVVDLPLIQKVAATGKPIIISTGMATELEISEAISAVNSQGYHQIILLRCVSSYPAPVATMNLASIPAIAEKFGTLVGLSDHSMAHEVPVAAVALGACMIEKHFTLSRNDGGPDGAFSLEPAEFKAMVTAVRTIENAIGHPQFGPTPEEKSSLAFRRSLFAVADIHAGEVLTEKNVRSIRPSNGLPPKYLPTLLGKVAACDIPYGTPLNWSHIQ